MLGSLFSVNPRLGFMPDMIVSFGRKDQVTRRIGVTRRKNTRPSRLIKSELHIQQREIKLHFLPGKIQVRASKKSAIKLTQCHLYEFWSLLLASLKCGPVGGVPQ